MLHSADMSRVKQKLFCAEEDIEIDRGSDVVKGYEVTPGNYVVMDDEDFDKVNVPSTHTIEITDFVKPRRDRPHPLSEDLLPRAGGPRHEALRAAHGAP